MDYEPAYTEEDVCMIVDEALKLVDSNAHTFDWREFKELPDVQFDNQMGRWLGDYRTGTSSKSGESRELPTEVELLLDQLNTDDAVRGLERELSIQESDNGRQSKSGESRELPTEAEELLDEMGDEQIVRALNRERALSTSSNGRPSKVDEWVERITNGEAELEDIDVGTVSDGADMSRKTFYKLRDRVEGSGED